jgi:hypothetical protein
MFSWQIRQHWILKFMIFGSKDLRVGYVNICFVFFSITMSMYETSWGGGGGGGGGGGWHDWKVWKLRGEDFENLIVNI